MDKTEGEGDYFDFFFDVIFAVAKGQGGRKSGRGYQ